jgi:hypothetical protein
MKMDAMKLNVQSQEQTRIGIIPQYPLLFSYASVFVSCYKYIKLWAQFGLPVMHGTKGAFHLLEPIGLIGNNVKALYERKSAEFD